MWPPDSPVEQIFHEALAGTWDLSALFLPTQGVTGVHDYGCTPGQWFPLWESEPSVEPHSVLHLPLQGLIKSCLPQLCC